MAKDNSVILKVKSIGENVSLVRMVASGFLFPYDLTFEALDEIKIALSEAVSNCMIHGYGEDENQEVTVMMQVKARQLTIEVEDTGIGIADISQAMEPAFSTRDEHMGLGFVFMQTFMDQIEVISELGKGTKVIMYKLLPAGEQQIDEVG